MFVVDEFLYAPLTVSHSQTNPKIFAGANVSVDESSSDYGLPISQGSTRNTIQESLDPIFTIIFIVEFLLKVCAQGFVRERGAYLRDGWNVLDFVIVLTSFVDVLAWCGVEIDFVDVSAIRTFRVLRPLRSLTALPGLQVIIISLLASIPALTSVITLICFIFAIFGILGMQVFAGITHQRCRLTPYPVTLDYQVGDPNYADFKVSGKQDKTC